MVFGLSITSFETMRHKLQSATLALRTQQVEQERANKLLAEARLSSLESRIHPHFLFNTLNSIAALNSIRPETRGGYRRQASLAAALFSQCPLQRSCSLIAGDQGGARLSGD
jgi:hypothetical protein